MENLVWYKVEEKQGTVLALAGNTLYRIGFTGKDANREATEVATALVGGQDPASVVLGDKKAVPLSAIQQVEVSHDRDAVKFKTVEGDKPDTVQFSIRSGDDAPAIARAVVERAGISHPERSEDISVFEALLGPVILGVLAGIFWALLYGAALSIDSDEDVHINPGRRRGRAIKQLFVFMAEILGTNGTIAVGVILLVAIVAWGAHLVVKRPQRLVWGPPTV